MSSEVALQSPPTDLLVAAIKSGNVAAVRSMVVQFPEAAHGKDSQDGASPAHWAALFGNLEVLQILADEGVQFDAVVPSSGMQPLHWASTHGHTDVVRFLLAQGVSINAVDIKKTTAIVIAAQYDHSVLVFFLAKQRADISLLDDCNDSALHWAAYKGNQQTAALLHYLGLPADAADAYGSTPLHLAASRNAPHVIEYLIDESTIETEKLVAIKDNKDRTALDIARERGHALAVRLLQRASPSLKMRVVNMVTGSDGTRALLYFYLVNGALCYIGYALLLAPAVGSTLWLRIYVLTSCAMQVSYYKVHTAPPGEISHGAKARNDYEQALASAADGSFEDQSSMPALCHTCRIVKPLRSKHCTITKKCVPMFDHFCPYIGNCIGGGNYIYFCAFIFCGLLNVGQSVLTAAQYLLSVNAKTPMVWIYLFDYSMVLLMAVLMNQYHLSLILRNLTTNEDMNKHRYAYLRNDLNQFHNPFSAGPWGNFLELFSRRHTVLTNPYSYSERYLELSRGGDVEMGECGAPSDAEHASLKGSGHGHKHSHSHSHH